MTDEQNLADKIERLDAAATAEQAVMVCPQCEGEGGYPDGIDEAACHTECTRCGGNGWIVDLTALRAAQPPADVAGLVERCRIMAMQRLFAEMDLDDQEGADWQLGYEHFVRESRWLFPQVKALSRRVEELEAENARMREALEQIGDTKPVPSPGIVCAKIARAALGGSIDAKA